MGYFGVSDITYTACSFRTAGAIVSFYELKSFLNSCSLVWVIETVLLFVSSEISMNDLKFIRPSLYIQTVLELINKWGKPQFRKIFYSPFSLSQIFQRPAQLLVSTPPELQVCLYCFYISKVSTPYKISRFPLNVHIQSLHIDKSRVDRKQYEGQYVLGFYILLC